MGATTRAIGHMSGESTVLLVGNILKSMASPLSSTSSEIAADTEPSAESGLQRVKQCDVDAVVSAYDLPDTDGLDFLQRVRDTYAGMPFVLCVEDGSEALARQAVDADATTYLPMSDAEPAQLAATLSDAMSTYRQRRREQRRAEAMECTTEGIAIIDEQKRYVDVNGVYTEMVGTERSALLGAQWSQTLPDEVAAFIRTDVRPALAETGEWSGEVKARQGDGTQFPKWLSIARLDDGCHVCVARNVSDRVADKQRLKRRSEQLDEFASVVSHDLQGPLSVLKGSLDLAEKTGKTENFDRARNAVERMDDLVEDVLTLAREGMVIGEVETVDLAALAAETWETVETQRAELQIETTNRIRADASRLRGLLANLMSNAAEHSNGAVTVTIGDLESGFFIEDGGPGIPPEKRERVFETGYSTSTDGTGFGLGIVERIVEAHGWSVAVTEGTDGGARFDIRGVSIVE